MRKVFIMNQWAIEEKKTGKLLKARETRTSDWFITWYESFSTNHTPKYTKTEALPDYFWHLNENYSMPVLIFERGRQVLVRICPSFNFASRESDFYFWIFSSAFFSTSTSSSSKNFPKCTHLKGFYCPFLRNLKLFFTRLLLSPRWWGLLSVTLHNPSFLSSRPLLTNILDQWARENFYSYYKNVYISLG